MKQHYSLKTFSWFIFMIFLSLNFQTANAQTTSTIPDTSKLNYNQVSSGLKLFVYPAKGQTQQQQKMDEVECYKWAMGHSGIDPLNLPKPDSVVAQSGPTGGAAKGAAKGAAAGAAVGAIAGDAGEGAAIGAAAGGARGRRAGKQAQAQQNQKAQAETANKEKEMMDNFKKGFSACLEGKGYTIK